MSIAIFTLSLCVFMVVGMPVAFALLLTGILMLWQLGFFDVSAVAQYMLEGADSYQLLAVPFFMLAGELMNAGGISRRIIALAVAWLAHVRGGLGYVAIAAALVLASLSGSAVADAAALAGLLLPMMRNNGYDARQSAGLISAGAVIAPIIPPSISFIVFGVTANVSVTKLFLAGIAPGILIGVTLAITWWWQMRGASVAMQPRQPMSVRLSALRDALWGLMLPVIVIVGLRGGIFTATEAAVVAAVYALAVGLFVYRELKPRELRRVFVASAKTTAVVMFLIAASAVSAYAITLADLPGEMARLIAPILDQPVLLMAAIMVLLVAVGAGLDITPTILILAPVLMPIVINAGIDPVYFGVMFVINGSIGLLTPPVGTVLNVTAGVGRMSLDDVIRGAAPYIVAMAALMFLFVAVPELITIPARWFTR